MSDTKLPPPNREGFKTFADWAINACCEKYTSTQNTCENASEITRKSNASGDLISREDAINAVCNRICEQDFCGCDVDDCPDYRAMVGLPSAERTLLQKIEELEKFNSDCPEWVKNVIRGI